ncbi:Fatty acid desaturase [Legionella massiliensis]|uniref:Fatty acid desaturase n=1 Tax=Legionella massiliensis TaxID=1034943 RepID=A0A078KQE5_9GAMM|nr:acyl-CoA desaturase [Legionella massiliensis]CDZ76615.1 Fatty acid desaturase [Legionella massiliensis]CEE12353.1 Fatty acid desaturase [Legionella massiliensis]
MLKIDKLYPYRGLNRSEIIYAEIIIWVPIIATIYSIISGMLFSIGTATLVLFLICYSCTVFGVTIGFHRLLTHHSFKSTRLLKIIFVCFGCMAFEGSPFFWVAAHRRHHKFTESEGDPHTPLINDKFSWFGFYHAHMGWMTTHIIESWRHYILDLLTDPDLKIINKHYSVIASLGLLIPAILNGLIYMSWYHFWEGLIVCGLVRVCLQQHVTWSINSVCHLWGKKDFDTKDQSRNNWLFAILAYGEGWHNGHHAFPSSAKHGLKKWQIDISFGLIKFLSWFGFIKEIKIPTQVQLDNKAKKHQSS